MLRLTQKGLDLLEQIATLSENDIRLLGFIANEKASIEKSVEGLEYIGNKREQVQRLQTLGYLKEAGLLAKPEPIRKWQKGEALIDYDG